VYTRPSTGSIPPSSVFHLAGRPTPEKIRRLHRQRFDQGVPVVVDLDG
jgi:hypothetical protein